MKQTTLDLLACPKCHGRLEIHRTGPDANPCLTGSLVCQTCSINYSIVNGIPHFIKPEELDGFNRRFARVYDLISWVYRASSKIVFAYIGMKEETGRREITDRLDPHGGPVLEVSIGPGVNLPYLVNRTDVGEVFGLDISLGQLQRCQSYVARKGWGVDLFLGNGEQLPFRNEAFDGIFHVGGINFFNNKKAAIEEMIRVAKPGTRILICDENEKGAQAYERFFPGFMKNAGKQREVVVAPVALIPSEMEDVRMYCIEFRKP
jgi:ubiquinone/menaquinone biosynthesis C-methylase UbiE